MHMDRFSMGRRLREARLAAGFKTAKAFAQTQALAQSTYSQYETGQRAFNADKLAHLCRALQIDAHWLLFGRVPYEESQRLTPSFNHRPFLKQTVRAAALTHRVEADERLTRMAEEEMII